MKEKSLQRWLVMGCCHVIGISVVSLVLALPLTGEALVGILQMMVAVPDLRGPILSRWLLHMGVAASIWAFLAILWSLLSSAGTRPGARGLVRARGVVATETLIVMPVFLLMMLGLVQLSLNNVAGMLGHVAQFNAARTVWVWAPEVAAGTISQGELEDRVRLAVAATMTPAAPANLPPRAQRGLSVSAGDFESIMTARFQTGVGALATGNANRLSVAQSMDGETTHQQRVARKFSHAYGSVGSINMTLGSQGQPVGAQMTYYQYQAVPIANRVFGTSHGGHYFSELTLGMTVPSQLYGVGRPSGF